MLEDVLPTSSWTCSQLSVIVTRSLSTVGKATGVEAFTSPTLTVEGFVEGEGPRGDAARSAAEDRDVTGAIDAEVVACRVLGNGAGPALSERPAEAGFSNGTGAE